MNEIPKIIPLDYEFLKHWLPKRPSESHKHLFGHVLIVGGDIGMSGAVRIAGEAALRIGAGLVTIATHPHHAFMVNATQPELMVHGVKNISELQPLLNNSTVIALGPGLGQSQWSQDLFNRVIQEEKPLVVDADGLNLLAKHPTTNDQWILTPHLGEAARLMHTQSEDIQNERVQSILKLQARYRGVVVLKGKGTLVCGNNSDVFICPAGNPGMSSAGMGDCLTGVIAGLLAQKIPLFEATKLGVLIHALAGDRASEDFGERGLLATDLIPYLHKLVNP